MYQSTQQSTNSAKSFLHLDALRDNVTAETVVIEAAAGEITQRGMRVTNGAVILQLITEVQNASDPVQIDLLLNALKIVVGMTPGEEERWAYFNW